MSAASLHKLPAMPEEITCLIVDDHEVVREGLRLSLSRAPHIRVIGEASDGAAAVALGEELAVHEFDRADIDAARRLLRNQDRRSVGQLARHHDLLQVSSGQRANWEAFAADPDVELRDEIACALRHRGTIEQPVPRQRRVAVKSDCEIFGRRRRQAK